MRIKLGIPLSKEDVLSITENPDKSPKENCVFSFLSTDSRECLSGDLFLPLKCPVEHIDDYSREARLRGAAVISKSSAFSDFTVEDPDRILNRMVSYHKSRLSLLKRTAAITGSVGKTTCKELTKNLLSRRYKVHATRENYNNAIGLPLTVLQAPKDTEIMILEMGMNHSGEISLLSRLSNPDLSLITNIGTAHIGNLGSREAIARAKLEILDGMREKNLLIPYGEPLLKTDAKTKSFSEEGYPADYFFSHARETDDGYLLSIHTPYFEIENARYRIYGAHNLSALISALAIASEVGMEAKELRYEIEGLNTSILRQKIIKIGKIYVYDDSYSASPEATIANLKMISQKFDKRSCVLGDMLELGDKTEGAHISIGYTAASLGFRKIYAFGNYAKYVSYGARLFDSIMDRCVENCDLNAPEITAKSIIEEAIEGETILFKGSHGTKVWRIYEKIKELYGE